MRSPIATPRITNIVIARRITDSSLAGPDPSGRLGSGPCGPGTRWLRQPFLEDALNGKRLPLSFASPIY